MFMFIQLCMGEVIEILLSSTFVSLVIGSINQLMSNLCPINPHKINCKVNGVLKEIGNVRLVSWKTTLIKPHFKGRKSLNIFGDKTYLT